MDKILREQLTAFLTTAQAHMTFVEAVADFPMEKINEFPPNVKYTPWMLLEHIRFTQKDILEFLINPGYLEPKWPEEYWPKKSVKATVEKWNGTLSGYKKDLDLLVKSVKNPKFDLSAKVKWGTGQSVIREILLVIDHNSYHIGEFAILRQVMGTWPVSLKK